MFESFLVQFALPNSFFNRPPGLSMPWFSSLLSLVPRQLRFLLIKTFVPFRFQGVLPAVSRPAFRSDTKYALPGHTETNYRVCSIAACIPKQSMAIFPQYRECFWSDTQGFPLFYLFRPFPVFLLGKRHVFFVVIHKQMIPRSALPTIRRISFPRSTGARKHPYLKAPAFSKWIISLTCIYV